MRRRPVAIVGVVVGLLFASVTTTAHHGAAAFDVGNEITLTGTVTEWIWSNPHCLLRFDVTDENGKTETWRGELSAVTSMIAAGLNRNTFKKGDAIKVEARIANSGEPFAVLGSLWKDGTKILDGEYRSETR